MSVPGRVVLGVAVLLYRAGLLLLPGAFRREFGPAMRDAFRSGSVDAWRCGGVWGVVRWWLRSLADLFVTVGREWIETIETPAGRVAGEESGGMRGLLDGVLLEAGFAVRSLARSPVFAVSTAVVLGVGVGANAVMFELVDRLLTRPPAYLRDPGSVHRVYEDYQWRGERIQDGAFSYPFLRDMSAALAGSPVEVAGTFGTTAFVSRAGGTPRPRPVRMVTGSWFGFFDARPSLGRFLGPDDDRQGAPAAVVLAHGFWAGELGGDRQVLGSALRVDGRDYTVVGVAPPGFHGDDLKEQVAFVPMAVAGADLIGPDFAERPFTTWLELLVRRPAGADSAAVAERLGAVRRAHMEMVRPDGVEGRDAQMVLAPVLRARGPHASAEARVSVWLLAMSVVVLLVACLNVSILMLGRALRRRRDAAVRMALGVRRGRLLAGPALESAMLAVVALVLAFPVAQLMAIGVTRVLHDGNDLPLALTARSMAVAAVAVLAVALATAAGPALFHLRRPGASELRAGGRAGHSRGVRRFQAALVGSQAALSAVLLLAAALFTRSVDRVRGLDLGYEPERVLLVSPEYGSSEGDDAADRHLRTMNALREAAATAPGITDATLTSAVPFWRNSYEAAFLRDGTPTAEGRAYAAHAVGPDYFRVLGTPILRGRPILATDDAGAPPVTVLSTSMARALWPGQDALGRCLRLGADTLPCSEVVGIAADIRRGDLGDDTMLQFYTSWPQFFYGTPWVVAVRTAGSARASLEPLRRTLQDVVGAGTYIRVDAFADRVDAQSRSWRTGAAVFGAFGMLALALAAFGLFSVVAWDVSQRRREFAVRSALGARAADILHLVMRKGLVPALAGIALGLALAWIYGTPAESFLFRVSARDRASFIAAAALLAAAALAAALIPGIRASRAHPREALDAE